MSNITLNELINFLDSMFPEDKKLEWDNVGFEIQETYNHHSLDTLSNIVVCLDVTKDVIEFAKEKKANFIITRHPFYFKELQNESPENGGLKNSYKREIVDDAVKSVMQFYSIHTNYDWSYSRGLFYLMNKEFNISNSSRSEIDDCTFKFELAVKVTREVLFKKIKKMYGIKNSNISLATNLEEEISEFYICSGAAGSVIVDNDIHDTTFITGEMKWNEWICANENNVSVLELGHYMENYFVLDIKRKIEKEFKKRVNVFAYDIKNQFKKF